MDVLELDMLIKCKICDHYYEYPVILPCGKTVCIKHTYITKISSYKCVFCNHQHVLPDEGFPFDERTAKLIDLSTRIDFGENNSKAKKECELLNDYIVQSKKLVDDPYCFINSHFSGLKYNINVKKQEYIALIEENHDRLIKEVNKYETKCRNEAQKKIFDFNESLQIAKSKLDQWTKELNVPNFTKDKQWKNIIIKSKQESEKIKYLLNNCKNSLLLHKDFKFHSKPVENDNNFGELSIEAKEKIDENRTEAKFQLIVSDFSDFINKKNELRESTDYCLIKNIPWRLRAVIHETADFQNALGFGFYPDLDIKKLKMNPINTEVKLKIVQKDNFHMKSELTLQRHFNHRFNRNQASGDPCFVLLKDIMDPLNGIYDEVSDCITLEAYVKVLN